MYYETHDEMTIAETLVALRQQRRYLVEMQEQFNFIKEFSQSAEAQRMINDLKNSSAQSAAARPSNIRPSKSSRPKISAWIEKLHLKVET